jgi:hypothetical protein
MPLQSQHVKFSPKFICDCVHYSVKLILQSTNQTTGLLHASHNTSGHLVNHSFILQIFIQYLFMILGAMLEQRDTREE